jgi:tetratricopeptide (TPR) repeat protein
MKNPANKSLPAFLIVSSFAILISVPMSGCSSTQSTRPNQSRDDALSEINPALAYQNRQRQESLTHYREATEFHIDGDLESALLAYRRALEIDNKLYAAWNNMGELLMEQNNLYDAISAFQIASELEPTDPRPVYNIGVANKKLGWAEDAYANFVAAIERDQSYVPALRGLIVSAEMLGRADSEIMQHIRNAQLRETDADWQTYLSSQFYRVEARIELEKSVKPNSDSQ